MFNALLEAAEIDPRNVRLLRHQGAGADRDFAPYKLWRDSYDDFMAHQSRQSARAEKIIGHAKFWASFVVTPDEETLFVGIYGVLSKRPEIFSTPGASKRDRIEAEPIVYELGERPELSELIAKVVIDWGGGFLPQVQRAETNDKQIIELRRESTEAQSHGCLTFIKRLADGEGARGRPWRGPQKPAKSEPPGRPTAGGAPTPHLRAVSS